MFRRALTKHALPVILSVAMIFQSAPATALAAENADVVVEETTESTELSDDSGDAGQSGGTDGSEVSGAADDDVSADSGSGEQEEPETEETTTEEQKAEETISDEALKQQDQQGTEETTQTEDPGTAGQTEDNSAKAADLDTVIRIKSPVEGILTEFGFQKAADNSYTATYTGGIGMFDSVMSELEDNKTDYFEIEIDGEVDDALNRNLLGTPGSLSLKWQQVLADGSKADVACPLDAGKYQLVMTLDAVPDVCREQSAVIDFEIKPVELQVDVDWDKEIAAGTTVGDYKEQLKKEYALGYRDEDGNLITVNKTAVVVEEGVELVVIDSYTRTPQEDTTPLRSDADYKVYFASLPLTDMAAANYKVAGVGEEALHNIKVSDLTDTEVVIEFNDPAKEITVVYDSDEKVLTEALEQAVKDAVKSVRIYMKPNENGSEEESDGKTEIMLAEGETPTLEWCTGRIDVSNNSAITYEPLGEGAVPVDAGEYYVRYRYAGREGAYAESVSEAVRVTIEPVSLILKLDEASKPVLQAGMDQDEVRQELSSLKYALYTYTVDDAGKIALSTAAYKEEENFWGVAYSDKDKTQYYKPLFQLEYRKAQTDENGALKKVDNVVQYNDWQVWNGSGTLQASEGQDREIEYRIVFTGEKAVFDAAGAPSKKVPVTDTSTMEAEKNYLVRADEQTRHLYSDKDGELSLVLPVDVKAAAKVEIDITGIVSAFKANINPDIQDTDGLSEENPLWKIYDGEALYTAREDYKKAAIKEEGVSNSRTALNENETLTYTWEYKSDIGSWRPLGNIAIDSDLVSTLADACSYRLTIQYTDTTHAKQAASKQVYFEVKQQEVIVVGEGFTARVGKGTDDLAGSYRVYKLPDNSEEAFAKLSDAEKADAVVSFLELFPVNPDTGRPWQNETDCKAYVNEQLRYQVQRQVKDDAGNEVAGQYVDVAEGETFAAGYSYRAYLYFADIRNTNYTNIDRAETEEDTEPPIYHSSWFDLSMQNIGTEELTVIVDKSRLPGSKTYDGEQISLEDAFDNGLFKIVLKNDHAQEVTDLTIGSAQEYFESLSDPSVEKKDVYYGVASSWDDYSRNKDFGYSWYALDAGTYYIGVWFAGNEKYADFDFVSDGTEGEECSFEIRRQPVTIRPVLTEDTVAAGEPVSKLYDQGTTPFEIVKGQIAPIDSWAFEYGSWTDAGGQLRRGYYAFGGTLNAAYRCEGRTVYDSDCLRYGKTYEADFANTKLQDIYARDYDISFEKASYKVQQRGNALVSETSYNLAERVRFTSVVEQGISQTITPVEGIPFSYGVELSGEEVDGNFFAFRITAPAEYRDSGYFSEYQDNYKNFVYENDIKNSGGYLIDEFTGYRKYITVLFDVTELKYLEADDPARKKEFSICWEDGYVEQFIVDFSSAVFEDNLQLAVAPKSLAFNGISSKMVIGEEQNLDVKITKVQLGDIISIAYETDAPDVLSIDKQTGHVTALQVSKPVTVTAYAYRLDKDGKEERLGKAATAKITVTDVTAPAIKKIDEIRDGGATIHFTPVTNGYRRELYVLEGKAAAAAFDEEIAKLEQGQANKLVKVVYNVDARSTKYKSGKTELYKYILTGLEKEKEYTVYIRNVSAVRTLADGSSVKLSAKGVVKNFKTTKPQVQQLLLYSEDEAATEVNAAELYRVSLDSKKVQMTTGGIYKDYGDFADSSDQITRVLPTKDKDVVNPKLTYEVHDYVGTVLSEEVSKYAAVNNKGQLTLKGTGLNGVAKVRVTVKADNGKSAGCDVIITAVPDAVKTKNAKLKVGDSVVISDYLNYTQGKTKVLNYISGRLEIVNREDLEKSGIVITEPYVDDDGFYHSYRLTAEKDGNVDVQIRDLNLKAHQEDGSAYVTVKLSVGKLDPVKSLKTAYADDSRITINFAHTGTPSDFLIAVEDGRGSLVSRKLVSAEGAEIYGADESDYLQEEQRYVVDGLTYFAKTKTYAYTIQNKLVRQSSYKISVTALYHGTEAKTAAVKAKTTNIPASHVNMAVRNWVEDEDGFVYRQYGGETIYVTDSKHYMGRSISMNPYLSSGNTYTLCLDANDAAKTRITDTLTWKSSDTKVATVKANAGTYTATLKAVKQGTTTIEVTSKITKKVIARYMIAVNPVNNGGNYYGDYEREWFRRYDPLYNGTVEVLTLSNRVSVAKYNTSVTPYTWVAFTAPVFGAYTFTGEDDIYFDIYEESGSTTGWEGSIDRFLESGQKIYFKVYGSFTLSASVQEFDKLAVGSTVAAAYGTWVSFTAPEDNYYTFKGVRQEIRVINGSGLMRDSLDYEWDSDNSQARYGRGMKAGESILLQAGSTGTISVEKRNLAGKELTTDGKDATTTLTNDVKEQWFRFTAPAAAEYTFTIEGADEVGYYKSINDQNPEEWETVLLSASPKFSHKIALRAGDVVMLKISLKDTLPDDDPARTVTINISQPKVETLAIGENTVTLPADSDEAWRSFEVAEGYYSFTVTGKDNNDVMAEYYNGSMEKLDSYTADYELAVPSGMVKAGEKIYLKISGGDAVVTIAEVKATAELKAGIAEQVELTGNGGNVKYWYTFTAPHDGNYIFRFETDKMKDGYSTTVTGNYLYAARYDGIFGRYIDELDIWNGESEVIVLSMGEILTLCLNVQDTDENYKLLGNLYVDDVKSGTGVVAAKVGENPIEINDAKDITNWYVFKADTKGSYTFAWVAAENCGDVEIALYNSMDSDVATSITDATPYFVNAGNAVYIKVVQRGKDAVKGALNITAPADAAPEKVKDGTLTFSDLAKDTSKVYTFTASWTTRYAVTTAVGENAAVSVYFDYSYMSQPYEEKTLEKGKTYRIEVTAVSDQASGTITIKPVAPAELKAGDSVTARKDGSPSWYVWNVGTAGRYNLLCSTNDNMDIEYYSRLDDSSRINDKMGRYFEAGESVYVRAVSRVSTEDQTASFTPDITMNPLELKAESEAGQTISVGKGTTVYYKYTAVEDGCYIFTSSIPEENGAAASSIGYAKNTSNSGYSNLPVDSFRDVELKKGDRIYVRMTASADADANFIFKLAQRKETALTAEAASGEITLESGKTAWFSYAVREDGEFVFKTQDVSLDTADLSYDASYILASTPVENGFYFVCKGTYNSKIIFSVTNNSAETVRFKVYTERVRYEILTEEKALTDLTVTKGELKWLRFTAPKDGRYTITSSNTADAALHVFDGSLYDDMPIEEDGTVTMYLSCQGSEPSAKTTVSVVSLKPEEITEAAITVAAEASKWVQYTAKKDGRYTFTLKDESGSDLYMTAYDSIIAVTPTSGDVITKDLKAGDSIYFKLTNGTGEDQNYVFTWVCKEMMIYTFVFDTYGDTHDMVFTAPVKGTYKVTGYVPDDNKSDFMVWVNESFDYENVWYQSNWLELFYGELDEGETVYLNMRPWNYSENNNTQYGGSISILVEQVE